MSNAKMRRALFKRENTITLSLVESQKHISQLLAQLETSHNGSGEKDFAYVQANISDLLGKFEDSHSDMQGDLHDILESLQKGTMSNDEISGLIRNEKERGALTIQLAEDLQSRMDEVLNFVAHFISDVEDGQALPKDSFKALFDELDTVADSVHAMGTVARTPSRRVKEIKSKVQRDVQSREEKSRGIGTSSLATFLQTRREEPPQRRKNRPIQSRDREDGQTARDRKSADMDKINDGGMDRNRIDHRAGSPSGRHSIRPTSSFRALSKQNSVDPLDSRGLSDEDLEPELELKGKKSNFAVKGIVRQKSGQQTIKSALVRSLTSEISDDDLSFDSGADCGRAHFKQVKVKTIHKQTQTEALDISVRPDGSDAISSTTKPHSKEGRNSTASDVPHQQRHISDHVRYSSDQSTVQADRAPRSLQDEQQHRASTVGVLRSHGQPVSAQQSALPAGTPIAEPLEAKTAAAVTVAQNAEGAPAAKTAAKAAVKGTAPASSKKSEKAVGAKTVGSKKIDLKVKSTAEPKRSDPQISTGGSLPLALSDNGFPISLQAAMTDEDKKALDEENEAKERSDPESKSSYLDMKEKRLAKMEALLSSRQENFEILCDTHIKQKMMEFEKKIREEVAHEACKSPLRDEIDSTGHIHKKTEQNSDRDGVSKGEVDSGGGQGGSEDKADPSCPPGDTPTTAKEFVSDGVSLNPTVTATSKEDMQKILKTLLLYLPRPGGGADAKTTKIGDVSDGDNKFDHPTFGGGDIVMRVHDTVHEVNQKQGGEDRRDATVKLPPISGGSRPNTSEASKSRPPSQPGSHRNRADSGQPQSAGTDNMTGQARIGSSVGCYDNITDDDDALSINFDRYDSDRRPNSWQKKRDEKLRHYDLKSGLGEIWVPPPTGLARKKMPSTIVIFPLHTLDQSTSTDDLNPPSPRPTAMQETSISSESIDVNSKREDTNRPATKINVEAMMSAPTTDRVPVADKALENIQKELTTSSNPLSTLYHHFFPYLTVLSRHHLMAAASGITCNRSGDVDVRAAVATAVPTYSTKEMAALFEMVAEEVSKLEYTSYHAMEALDLCEQDMNNLIVMASAKQELDNSFYVGLRESSRQLGEIEIAEAWTDMLLTNSRTIFARVRALGIDPKTIGDKYIAAHSAFLACQGTNVALKERLRELKKRIDVHLKMPMHIMKHDSGPVKKELMRKLQRATSRCEDLEERLADTQDELEELRVQIINMDRVRDTTPAALWFFSALHNPRLPEVVANHLQQLSAVKGVIEGKEHFDFSVMKRRLDSCYLGLPAIQNFFKKFSIMQKKYTQTRSRLFLDRKLIGGDADAYFVCPMCNTDCRDNPAAAPVPRERGNEGAKTLQSRTFTAGLSGSPALTNSSKGGQRSSFGR